jgi:glycosyltransferase involved in cell wall biosynthesis
MKKPKICFILQDFAIGGIETCLYNLAAQLKDEFEFHFIATHVKHIEPKFTSIGPALYIPVGRKLVRYLKDQNFDLVQTHNLRDYVDCALEAGVPVIVERVAGNRSTENSKDGVNWVVASNKGTLPLIQNTIDPSLVSVIYNGVDIEALEKVQPNRLDCKDTDVIIGRVSRLGRGQNIHMLVRAMVRIVQKYPHAKLIVVGGTSRMPGAEDVLPELKKLAMSIRQNVIFTGEIDQPFDILKGFDIATCVSNHEGIPNSLLEAMACGKPVIGTNVGQIPELIDHEVNGFLIPPNNDDALLEALDRLIADHSLRQKFGQAGKLKVKDFFDIKKQSRRYADLYKTLLEKKKHAIR